MCTSSLTLPPLAAPRAPSTALLGVCWAALVSLAAAGVHSAARGHDLTPPLASAALPEVAALELRVTGNGPKLTFAYALQPGKWKSFLPVEAYPVSVQAAGDGNHFTGALVGLHARVEP